MDTGSKAMVATEQGKAFALAALQARREANTGRVRVNNSTLPAGSPMFFYCIGCGAVITVHESYIFKPKMCVECEALHELGWFE